MYLELFKNNFTGTAIVAGLKYTGLLKSDLVGILDKFLLNENNIDKIWKEV